MRPLNSFVYALAGITLLSGIASGRGILPLARRDDISSTGSGESKAQQSTITSSSVDASATSSTQEQSSNTPKKSSATTSATDSVDTTAGGSIPIATSTDSVTNSSTIANPNQRVYDGGLPIAPKITPGLSVAGVVLIIAGTAYCLIGIKIKRLHIFLSTAFLCSLSVTVLVVYVMNPPVSAAIQGAYVTAAIITGAVVGGLACVFPEVTEGLGCLLGGFCLSMWFLVLKPGGLVSSVYGKLIMIAVCCLTIFALAFHRITRPYGLIFSLSFAGATAMVLGIDCFSRAGLKEFWLYIWMLNDRIFPLSTNTYPHTRGIRVEIAVIVLVSALGIMSQVKLFKILKERRAIKDAEKRQQEARLEAQDDLAGRRVVEEVEAERAHWEALYGEKDIVSVNERPATGRISSTDSGIGDDEAAGRGSGEVAEQFVETEEMRKGREEHMQRAQAEGNRSRSVDEESQPGNGTAKAQSAPNSPVPIPVGVDEITEIRSSAEEARQSSEVHPRGSHLIGNSRVTSQADWGQSIDEVYAQAPEPPLVRLPPTPAPQIIPLPLPRLVAENPAESNDGSDESSLATIADTDQAPEGQVLCHSTRDVRPIDEEEEDDDGASSIGATCDDQLDPEKEELPKLNRNSVLSISVSSIGCPVKVGEDSIDAAEAALQSPFGTILAAVNTKSKAIFGGEPDTEDARPVDGKGMSAADELQDDSALDMSGEKALLSTNIAAIKSEKEAVTNQCLSNDAPVLEDTLVPSGLRKAKSVQSLSNRSATKSPRLPPDLAPASSGRSRTPKAQSSRSSKSTSSPTADTPEFNSQLQAHCSKVLKTYRTNEWAKHLSSADKPEPDELHEPTPIPDQPEEKPAPLHIEALQETSNIRARSQPAPRRRSKSSSSSSSERIAFAQPAVPPMPQRALVKTSSIAMPPPAESIEASPVDDHYLLAGRTTPLPLAARSTPIPFSQATLMGKRESMVRSKTSFYGLDQYTTQNHNINSMSFQRSPTPMGLGGPMNVANRQSSVGQLQSPENNGHTLPSKPLNFGTPALDDDMPLANRRELLQHSMSQQSLAPPPLKRRSMSQQFTPSRQDLMKSWRESVKVDLQAEQAKNGSNYVNHRRTEMVNERHQAVVMERQKMLNDTFKEEIIDERMRQQDMLELHKEAMRKMQASANKHI